MRVETAGSVGTSYSDQINASIALAKTFVVELTNGGFVQEAATQPEDDAGQHPLARDGRRRDRRPADPPQASPEPRPSRRGRSRSPSRRTRSPRSRRSTSRAPRSRSAGCRRRPTRSASASAASWPSSASATAPPPRSSATRSQALRDSRTELAQQIAIALADGGRQSTSVQLTAPATAGVSPISPRLTFDVLLGLLVGLLGGVLLAWVRDQLDRSIHDLDEVEQTTAPARAGHRAARARSAGRLDGRARQCVRRAPRERRHRRGQRQQARAGGRDHLGARGRGQVVDRRRPRPLARALRTPRAPDRRRPPARRALASARARGPARPDRGAARRRRLQLRRSCPAPTTCPTCCPAGEGDSSPPTLLRLARLRGAARHRPPPLRHHRHRHAALAADRRRHRDRLQVRRRDPRGAARPRAPRRPRPRSSRASRARRSGCSARSSTAPGTSANMATPSPAAAPRRA